MAQVDMSRFKPLKYSFGKVHVSGGYSNKSNPMMTMVASEAGCASTTFVKLALTEKWLVLATTGQAKYSASSFNRTSLLDELRDKIAALCDGADSRSSAAVDKESDEYDPMAEVHQYVRDDQASSATKSRGGKRMRYYKNQARELIRTFDMPGCCPQEDPNCNKFRHIKMFIQDRKQLWLDIAECGLGSEVPLCPESTPGSAIGSCGFDWPSPRPLKIPWSWI